MASPPLPPLGFPALLSDYVGPVEALSLAPKLQGQLATALAALGRMEEADELLAAGIAPQKISNRDLQNSLINHQPAGQEPVANKSLKSALHAWTANNKHNWGVLAAGVVQDFSTRSNTKPLLAASAKVQSLCAIIAQSPYKTVWESVMGWSDPFVGREIVRTWDASYLYLKTPLSLVHFYNNARGATALSSAHLSAQHANLLPSDFAHPEICDPSLSALVFEVRRQPWCSEAEVLHDPKSVYDKMATFLEAYGALNHTDKQNHVMALLCFVAEKELSRMESKWSKDKDVSSAYAVEKIAKAGWPIKSLATQCLGAQKHPMISAIQSGNQNLVRALLKKGVDPNVVDQETGDNIWHMALSSAGKKAMDAFAQIPPQALAQTVNQPNKQGVYPIHVAVQTLNVELVKRVLEAGAEPSQKDAKGQSPLARVKKTSASIAPKLQQISDLLEQRAGTMATWSQTEKDGALFVACRALSEKTVRDLISAGANIQAQDGKGRTPLVSALAHFAPSRGEARNKSVVPVQNNIVALLIELGSDVNAKDAQGNTALHMATKNGLVDAVRMLIHSGANIHALNNQGLAPAHLTPAYDRDSAIGKRFVDLVFEYAQAGLDFQKNATSQYSDIGLPKKLSTLPFGFQRHFDPDVEKFIAAWEEKNEIDRVLKELQLEVLDHPAQSTPKKRM